MNSMFILIFIALVTRLAVIAIPLIWTITIIFIRKLSETSISARQNRAGFQPDEASVGWLTESGNPKPKRAMALAIAC